MNKKLTFLICSMFIAGSTLLVADAHKCLKTHNPKKLMGVFKQSASRLEGIRWGNWGSRPYEYYWASKVVSMEGKRVIDLGVGLPSQYNWYSYAAQQLKPAYYVGIDTDGRMKSEIIHGKNFDMIHMNMAQLDFPDKSFDLAYCISTFEHIPHEIFMKAISEAYRVLKNDGLLILTLDEQWDKNIPLNAGTGWNDLEQSLVAKNLFRAKKISFGLPEFLDLIKDYFAPVTEDATIDLETQTISSPSGEVYYQRDNRDPQILYSPECYNSCVSYAVLKKVNK